MASIFTPNVGIEEPASGDYVGTWDQPVNNNSTLLDLLIGGTATVTINSTTVTLISSQFRCKTLIFSSTLTANTIVTFPSSFTKSYEILNSCTGSSAFTLTLQSGAGLHVCPPPGEFVDIINTGTNFYFKNLGRVGSLWEHGGSSVPNWIVGCSQLPYLICDGTSFSSATYPILSNYLAGTTLPDLRGVSRANLNQGTGRLSIGNTNLSIGGVETAALAAANIPSITASNASQSITVYPGGVNGNYAAIATGGAVWSVAATQGSGFYNAAWSEAGGSNVSPSSITAFSANNPISATYSNASPTAVSRLSPTTVCGITMIRAG